MLEWKAFLAKLDQELGANVVSEWVRALRILRFDAANLYLQAENSFQIAWFEEHIRPRLKNRFVNNNLRPITVHVQMAQTTAWVESGGSASTTKAAYPIRPDPLERDFTFEHFLTSEKNQVACRLLQELHSPSLALGTFNPIFLYGPKRSGKTHLLTAAAHVLGPQKNIFFVRADTFTEHVVQAIRFGAMSAFRQTYRDIDLLIVDDVQVFAKKTATQEEFFHTFNTLHMLGKQIILSADKAPSQLSDIEPRLISRFEWGLSLQLEPLLDLQAILERKAKIWQLSIHPTALSWIGETILSNPIKALQALALRAGRSSIDLSTAQKHLQDFLTEEKRLKITPEQILKKIAGHFGIKTEDLLGKSQAREYMLPKQIAMYACRHQLRMPFQAIGALFNRDHSTVMANIKQIEQAVQEKKPEILQKIESVFK